MDHARPSLFCACAAQNSSWYAIKDVVYLVEVAGDSTTGASATGRGYFAFAIENTSVTALARTGVSYGSEGVLKVLSKPVLNKTGQAAFQSTFEIGGPVTASGDTGLFFSNGSGNVLAAALKGRLDFTGSGGAVFGAFSDLALDDDADLNSKYDLTFTATSTGAGYAKAFYSVDSSAASARTEFRLSDYVSTSYSWKEGGGFLSEFNTPVRVAADGTGVFTAKMSGIPIVRDTGIFASTPRLVIQEEDPAPGTAEDVEFADFSGTPSVNSSNYLAFVATLRGGGVTATNDSAVYTVSNFSATAPNAPSWSLRLRKGLAAGNTAGGAVMAGFTAPRVNSGGHIALLVNLLVGTGFPATTMANDTAILSDLGQRPGLFAVVAREGDTAKDSTGAPLAGNPKFSAFTSPVLITNNGVVFSAKLSSGVMGIWIWNGHSLFNVALVGGTAPTSGATAGAKFATLGTPLCSIHGFVAFTATLSGSGVTTTNNAGLWAVSEDGVTPTLRLRKGDTYNFHTEHLPFRRTVTALDITSGSGGDDGFQRGMDMNGNMGVLINFGKSGVDSGMAILKVAP